MIQAIQVLMFLIYNKIKIQMFLLDMGLFLQYVWSCYTQTDECLNDRGKNTWSVAANETKLFNMLNCQIFAKSEGFDVQKSTSYPHYTLSSNQKRKTNSEVVNVVSVHSSVVVWTWMV